MVMQNQCLEGLPQLRSCDGHRDNFRPNYPVLYYAGCEKRVGRALREGNVHLGEAAGRGSIDGGDNGVDMLPYEPPG